MKTLDIVYVLDELADVCLGLPKRVVLLQINLLSLERFEETLRFGVILWIANSSVKDDPDRATPEVTVRYARPSNDLDWLKALSDQHKSELGFVRRGELLRSIEQSEMLVIEEDGQQCGFVQFHHRRDGQTTIYNIIVASEMRGRGLGKELIEALALDCQAHKQTNIRLKCPDSLEANKFYMHIGFQLTNYEEGKLRALNIWDRTFEAPILDYTAPKANEGVVNSK